MEINGTIWMPEVEKKLILKHNIEPYEVEEMLGNEPHFRFVENGHVEGENLYSAMGQSESGRYVIAFFIYKGEKLALILWADMSDKERKAYDRAKR